jgi:hypothetical protein
VTTEGDAAWRPYGRGVKMRVLIAGGGAAGVEAALALRALAGERVEIELLSPRPDGSAPLPLSLCRLEPLGVRLRTGSLESVDVPPLTCARARARRSPTTA